MNAIRPALLAVAAALVLVACQNTTSADPATGLTLVLGSWRNDDGPAMEKILAAFHAANPDIIVRFEPEFANYDNAVMLKLASGKGPDLYYLRSWARGLEFHQAGHLSDLSADKEITGLFSPGSLDPWTSPEGTVYAMPLMAVSHGVYYNKGIFTRENLSVPSTWEEFVSLCTTLKNRGLLPLANTLGDQWDILEVAYLNFLPSVIGGRDGRLAYEKGTRAFNDAAMVESFTMMQSLAPWLPAKASDSSYSHAHKLFAQGEAAMLFDGS